ncbi:polyamine deacetylase HDAC10 isoform X5 [Pan paniscus]|uniref:polyamine deacetylase HDAC10 isoform X5 n=1 Tax=Pan paniscus TaxID=9597 RepID=UPI003005354E
MGRLGNGRSGGAAATTRVGPGDPAPLGGDRGGANGEAEPQRSSEGWRLGAPRLPRPLVPRSGAELAIATRSRARGGTQVRGEEAGSQARGASPFDCSLASCLLRAWDPAHAGARRPPAPQAGPRPPAAPGRSPECEIERPERLTAALDRLRQRGLEQRCLRLSAREASEEELGLVHRPPGHHSQRAAANGFCVFNNVAIAAAHAKQKHGLHRILVVDWDVHHGQGIQYLFEDDPSVLYFSWHRYEHGRFWPFLRESDADAVGRGQGLGFTVNLPWNQVGMGNADYVAAFLHLLLPLAFEFDPELVLVSAGFDSAIGDPEGQMQATPECFAHLTQLLQVLAGGRVCAVLEGGYHLESLAESVCMTVQTLLGDPAPPLSGPMVPCQSALESIQSARAAQAPHWKSLQHQDVTAVPMSPSSHSPEGRPPPLLPGGPVCKAAASALSSLLDQPCLCPAPSVRTAVALTTPDITLVLPPDVIQQEASALREETEAWARPHESLAREEALTALGKLLYLLDGMLDGQVNSGIAATPASAAAATLDVAVRRGLSHGAQRLLCVALGQLDRPPDLAHDGRSLWLNIRGKEAAALSMFHVSTPLPVMTGGFLSCVLGLVLPLAYGFQPDLVLVALGPGHGLQGPHAALLAAMLRGLAGGRVLALLEEDSTPQLAGILARVLNGEAPPSLGPSSVASPEDVQALMYLRGQLEPQWKMLQCHPHLVA